MNVERIEITEEIFEENHFEDHLLAPKATMDDY